MSIKQVLNRESEIREGGGSFGQLFLSIEFQRRNSCKTRGFYGMFYLKERFFYLSLLGGDPNDVPIYETSGRYRNSPFGIA